MIDCVGKYIVYGWVDGGREGCNCCMDRLLLDVGPSLFCHHSPFVDSWTQIIAFN